jgi:hypothetical protein
VPTLDAPSPRISRTSALPAASPKRPFWLRFLLRVALLAAIALVFGAILNRVASTLEQDNRPAGFFRGMVQGALMPMAMPNLLVGRDITIYSPRNTGVQYKLGYTLGVNVCGAVFFGGFYWRVNRWRRRNAGQGDG